MQFIGYLFFRLFIIILGIMPFWMLYKLSDFLAFLMLKIGYRKRVIIKNLDFAFPEKSQEWKNKILPNIYKNFTDIILESFKGMFISVKSIDKRYKILLPEKFIGHAKCGKDIVAVAGHYTNWEWGVIALASQTPFKVIGLYKPLSNKYIDAFIGKGRAKSGISLVSIYGDKTAMKKDYDLPKSIIYVADQNPSNKEKAHKIKFLNRETICLHGATESAIKNDNPIWYYKIERMERGKYQVTPTLLSEGVHEINDAKQLTQLYFNELEKQILSDPSNWLWTHKRWKDQIKY